MKWAIVALTKAGAELGLKLQGKIPGSMLYVMPGRGDEYSGEIKGSLKEFVSSIFGFFDVIVFIMAAGIVVRTIDGLLRGKTEDPAVLIMDEKGKFVISLLSGHIGGANRAAEHAAGLIGAVPVITTSSDVNGILSPDMLAVRYGLIIDDMKRCGEIASILVNGGTVSMLTDCDFEIPHPYLLNEKNADGYVCITNRVTDCELYEETGRPMLNLVPRNIVIGTGCKSGTSPGDLKDFIEEELELLSIDRRAVCAIASIDIKRDEPAVRSAARSYDAENFFFSAGRITEVEHLFECSDFVREKTGAGCVAEPCAYLASGREGKLLLPKKKKDGMTIAIMEKPVKEVL